MLTRRGLMLGLVGLPAAGVAAVAARDRGLIVAGAITSEQITATESMPLYDPRKETVEEFEARRHAFGTVTDEHGNIWCGEPTWDWIATFASA